MCVFIFVSVIPRVLHLCFLFLSACYNGHCYEYTWVFGLFNFFLHWYLGDFMKIMFHGKIVCLASLALALAVAWSEATGICESL